MAGSLEDRALEPWFIEEDSPSLFSTVSSHSLEQEPWGSGAFLKGRVRAPGAYGQVTSPTLCPAREGAVFVAAAGGAGRDWILQELHQHGTAVCLGGLAVDGSAPCVRVSLSVQPPASERPAEETRGKERLPTSREDHLLP